MWHYKRMNTALFLFAGIAVLPLSLGGIVAWVALHRAPDGFEDADGFHVISNRERPTPVLSLVVASPDAHHEEVSLAA